MPRIGNGLQQLAVRHGEKRSDDTKFQDSELEVSTEESDFLLYDKSSGGKVKSRQSNSQQAQISHQRRMMLHIVTSFLVLAQLAANINYLVFKFGLYSRELSEVVRAPWLMVVLCCEVVYLLCGVISAVDYLIPPNSRLDITFDDKRYPTVHVLLPTCNEPTDVPKESILAALAMHYPKDRFKVLVLDDGPNEDLKAFCQALQVETGGQLVYLRRKKVPGVPHNFKCGNINFGLEHSNAEYVVVMDADMILSPSFLRRVLPHIVDSPEVSFVQIPQAYYNLPIGDPLNDSSMMWYERVLVHRDSLGSANCIGTGALFRRKHLNVIGGFQPQSITEDTMTAYVLFNQGFKSVYLNEKLQMGMTPWTFEGYIRQRQRWGMGAIQQFAATWKVMLGWRSNLSLVQQVLYFWHTAYYYLSVLNLALMGALLAALAFHLNISVGDAEDNRRLISYLAVSLVLGRLAWMSLWLPVPMAVQSRNRDESHFWWMTPFFFKMVCQSVFSWTSTFTFVPTSNVDRAAGGKSNHHMIRDELRQVRFHILYAAVVVVVVIIRGYVTITKYGLGECRETFFTVGLSVFLFSTAVHMLVPAFYIVSSKYKPSERKSLLRYDVDGVPRFSPADLLPKWHWTVLFYEALSMLTLFFWSAVLYTINTGLDLQFCEGGSF